MFSGFTDETFQFFAAIRFNNNVSFFHANHDWYERAVREPLKDLAAELGETVLSIGENLETRPEKVVSRINRDIRFSKDKSPYRDHMWLSFRRPGTPQGSELCIYVAVDVSGCEVGFGIHDQVRPLMNAIRREIRVNPEGFEEDAQAAHDALPPILGVLLRPAGAGRGERVLLRGRGEHLSVLVGDDALHARGAHIDARQQSFSHSNPPCRVF